MTEKRKPYKTYTKAFKLEALRLMETTDRPASEIAMQLGIRRNQLYKWKEQLRSRGEDAFPGKGRREEKDDEIARLKRELNWVREENEILKWPRCTLQGKPSEVPVYPGPAVCAPNYDFM